MYVRTHVRTCTESKQFATGSVTSGLRRLCRDPSILKNGCKAIVGIDVVMLHMGIRNTTAMAPPVHRAPQLSAPELAWQCSYKRVKGRGHTAEKRISMHPHRPHATSQPLRPSQWLCIASADVMMGHVYGAVFVVVLVLR